MVLATGKVTAFFESPNQIAAPHETRIQLQSKVMPSTDNLEDSDKGYISNVCKILRRPGRRTSYPNPNAAVGGTVHETPFVLGTNIQMRLHVACDLVWCCAAARRAH